MARPVNEALRNQWRRRIDRQADGDLSIAEFCRKENVSPQAFYAWKRKFRDTADRIGSRKSVAREVSPKRAVVTRHSPRRSAPRPTMPVRRAEFLELPLPAARSNPWIELALADGTIVRLPHQNLAALVAVLQALRGERLDLATAEDGHA